MKIKKETKKELDLLRCGVIGAAVGIVLFVARLFIDWGFLHYLINLIVSPFFIFYKVFMKFLMFFFAKYFSILIFYFIFLIAEGFIVGTLVGFIINKVREWKRK